MSKIEETKGTLFGALKLIEQLYLDGYIPGFVFRNILKEHMHEIDISCFQGYANEAGSTNEVKKCTD